MWMAWFTKLLLSPVPHGRVVKLDASAALAMDGVLGVLTADDLAEVTGASEPILTNEPLHVGAPIAAIAATKNTHDYAYTRLLKRFDIRLMTTHNSITTVICIRGVVVC